MAAEQTKDQLCISRGVFITLPGIDDVLQHCYYNLIKGKYTIEEIEQKLSSCFSPDVSSRGVDKIIYSIFEQCYEATVAETELVSSEFYDLLLSRCSSTVPMDKFIQSLRNSLDILVEEVVVVIVCVISYYDSIQKPEEKSVPLPANDAPKFEEKSFAPPNEQPAEAGMDMCDINLDIPVVKPYTRRSGLSQFELRQFSTDDKADE